MWLKILLKMKIQTSFNGLAIAALFGASALAVDSCTHVPALAKKIAGISVTLASWTSRNELVLSDSNTEAALPNQHAFCRVKGHIEYSGNNSLAFELWLPEQESYNERYLVAGKSKHPVRSKKRTDFK